MNHNLTLLTLKRNIIIMKSHCIVEISTHNFACEDEHKMNPDEMHPLMVAEVTHTW